MDDFNIIACAAADEISCKVEKSLMGMEDDLLSPDGSGLQNTWEEICVQVQFEESMFWDIYNDTVNSLIRSNVEKLEDEEKAAIWLQTDNGKEWKSKSGSHKDDDGLYCVYVLPEHEVSEKDSSLCYNTDDIVYFISREYVYVNADDYSNKRIEKYKKSKGY